MESSFFMDATGRHVGHRLVILTSSSAAREYLQHKTLQPEGINTFGIVLARTLLWTQKASYTYVHIWLVELRHQFA